MGRPLAIIPILLSGRLVSEISCYLITSKRDAIYPATIVGIPPMEDSLLAKITERLFLSPIKLAIVPEVVDMFLPVEGLPIILPL